MKFLKDFFDDDSNLVGLCGFKMFKAKYSTSPVEQDFFFNPFEKEKIFETNFSQNILLL